MRKTSWERAADAARGDRGDRFAKLEDLERRCNGDSHCTRTAQVEFELQAVDPNTEDPIGDPEIKRVCTRHRLKYEAGAQWKVLRTTEMGTLGPKPRRGR